MDKQEPIAEIGNLSSETLAKIDAWMNKHWGPGETDDLFAECYAVIETLSAVQVDALDALRELVRLKRIKDNSTSTAEEWTDYYEHKSMAWKAAFEIVDATIDASTLAQK